MADWCSSYHGLSPMTSMPLSQPWLMCPTAWMCEEEAAGVRRIINNRGNTALSPDNHRCIPCARDNRDRGHPQSRIQVAHERRTAVRA